MDRVENDYIYIDFCNDKNICLRKLLEGRRGILQTEEYKRYKKVKKWQYEARVR